MSSDYMRARVESTWATARYLRGRGETDAAKDVEETATALLTMMATADSALGSLRRLRSSKDSEEGGDPVFAGLYVDHPNVFPVPDKLCP